MRPSSCSHDVEIKFDTRRAMMRKEGNGIFDLGAETARGA